MIRTRKKCVQAVPTDWKLTPNPQLPAGVMPRLLRVRLAPIDRDEPLFFRRFVHENIFVFFHIQVLHWIHHSFLCHRKYISRYKRFLNLFPFFFMRHQNIPNLPRAQSNSRTPFTETAVGVCQWAFKSVPVMGK